MTKLAAPWRAVPLLFLSLFLTGCFPLNRSGLEEEKDPHYIEGENRLKSFDFEGAIQSFERALQTNPKNSAAHLQLGTLYDRMDDPASALYHYQRHLALKPDSNMADIVKGKIVGCTHSLAQKVALVIAPGHVQQEMARLAQANQELRNQVATLQHQLAQKPQVITNMVYLEPAGAGPSYYGNGGQDPEPEPEEDPEPWPVVQAEVPRPQNRTPATRAQTPDPEPEPRTPAPAPAQRTETAATANNDAGGWIPDILRPGGRSSSSTTTTRPAAPPPRPRTAHRLKKGETIAALSRQYGVSIAEIVAANPGIKPNRVQVGQTIYIPAR